MKVTRYAALASLALAVLLAAALPARLSQPGAEDDARLARYDDWVRSGSTRRLATSVRAPSDPLWSQAWSLRALGMPDVWPSAVGGPSTLVAVIDTGVDSSQPDLAGALVPGFDTLASASGTADENGHGTAVAGVIAARSDNKLGVTSVCGTCSVMPVKVIGPSGLGDSSHIASGIVWAADHGARVINLSVVLDGPQQAVEDAVHYAHERGVVLVAAAGNGGGSQPTYPAAYPEVIGVAASQEDGSLYPWSQRGPWVDVAAPGCSPSTARGGDYTIFCGTSSASAATSGLVALALSAVPGTTNVAVESALARTARPLGDGALGFGRIDAVAFLDTLRAGATPAAPLVP